MYQLIKKLLFRLDPEVAHEHTISSLKMANNRFGKNYLNMLYKFNDVRLHNTVWGIDFPNPVGLGAGFDKNAEVYKSLSAIGFGFVEVGTLTPVGQPGNEKPRLFRLVTDQAVINRMGFNNIGAEEAVKHLVDYKQASIPIGINIGKNKLTVNENAFHDYIKCLDILYPYGDYFVINISSPNTPNLRNLQESENLRQLLQEIYKNTNELEMNGAIKKPILLKVAPDMEKEQMNEILQVAISQGISGIIATNTTLSREGLRSKSFTTEVGGLSGKPLANRSTKWIREIYHQVGQQVPIIAVGGIFTGEDAYEKIRAGASLVQVYTGMIYQGPGIVKSINKRLLELMEKDGFTNIRQVIGIDSKE
ncbi:quinone-dependent dihydroorotate dehydrogenase [Peribacillus simplex]|uniref:Dihydroorotate dehydrogenase (quinone) n=2 Tax=Peribacillus TaxID=2675229 RepID=A0AA90T3U1_9BACI|nr:MULTISPECIES: quinone-dependent dihydroorotate dehydrogenase [Peribacillus]MDP1419758.1 quinone-dependent dihydroorotate dehydrogenase [Peribacillus simplex]MDP1452998.1 quinone-dependent dihydroorotate dehydrogenase [Peribacillus frigoritolerans]